MPCVYFSPRAPADWSGSYPRLPLGEAWDGRCAAPSPHGEVEFAPQGALLFEVCNTGQGRCRCARFPKDAARDSVRFHVVEDSGDRLLIRYVFQNDCWPAGHGLIEFFADGEEMRSQCDDPLLNSQASAFVSTWVRRRAPGPR